MEIEKQKQRNNNTKNQESKLWFTEKINKINRPFTQVNQTKRYLSKQNQKCSRKHYNRH